MKILRPAAGTPADTQSARTESTGAGRSEAARAVRAPRRHRARDALTAALVIGMLALVVARFGASGMVGSGERSLIDVLGIAYRRAWGVDYVPDGDLLVAELRLPRGMLAAIIGASLGLVGCVLQAVVRNPLADSSILGGTSGAALGAVGVIALAPGAALSLAIPTGAFAGAGVGFALTILLASARGAASPLKLVLAGMAVSFLLAALTDFVIIAAGDDRKLRSAIFWQLGSVAGAQWGDMLLPVFVLVCGIAYLLVRARRLDTLAFGDHTAHALGTHPGRLRAELITICALIVGVGVAAAGGIGFVSLVIPHAVRLVVGTAHRRLLPAAAATGAAFLTWADVVSRVITPPSEIPLGVITAIIGSTVFAVLMITRMRGTL